MGINYYFQKKGQSEIKERIESSRKAEVEKFLKWLREIATEENRENIVYDVQAYINDIIEVQIRKIHIGKRSSGWKPMFEKNESFNSVKTLKKFYDNNKETHEIVNEYGDKLNWHELEKELIFWNKDDPKAYDISTETYFHYGESAIYKDEEGYTWCDYEFE